MNNRYRNWLKAIYKNWKWDEDQIILLKILKDELDLETIFLGTSGIYFENKYNSYQTIVIGNYAEYIIYYEKIIEEIKGDTTVNVKLVQLKY